MDLLLHIIDVAQSRDHMTSTFLQPFHDVVISLPSGHMEELEKGSVPVDANIVLNMIYHPNNDTVAFPGDDPRPRNLAVNGHDTSGMAQSSHVLELDLHTNKPNAYMITHFPAAHANAVTCIVSGLCAATYVEFVVPGDGCMCGSCKIRQEEQSSQCK